MSISPIAPRSALPVSDRKPAASTEPGSKPYTRSGSAPGLHIAGARGELGNPRVNVNTNGVPSRLLGVRSNGEPFVAVKAKTDERPGAEPSVQDDVVNSRGTPNPHIPGAAGTLGDPVVNANANGVPTHIVGVHSNGKPFVAHKV